MLTSSPVRGLRPMPVLRGFTLKTSKRRASLRWPRLRACFDEWKNRRYISWGGMDGCQARPLDPAQSAGAKNDRAVYRPAGARGSDQLRSVVVRLRHPRGGRVPDFHEREFDDCGPQAVRSEIV